MQGGKAGGAGGPRPLSFALVVRGLGGATGRLRGAVYMGERVELIDTLLPYRRAVDNALDVLVLLHADVAIEAELWKGARERMTLVSGAAGGTDVMMWNVQGTSGSGSSGGPESRV
jgi:hypothetical protein